MGYEDTIIQGPEVTRTLPPGASPWVAEEHGIDLRATGVHTPPVYVYRGSGQDHRRVVGPGPERAFVVDIAGHEDEPWWVAAVLAYGFFDLAYKETMRYQRQYVWGPEEGQGSIR